MALLCRHHLRLEISFIGSRAGEAANLRGVLGGTYSRYAIDEEGRTLSW